MREPGLRPIARALDHMGLLLPRPVVVMIQGTRKEIRDMEETDNSGEMRKSGREREADRCERGKGRFA